MNPLIRLLVISSVVAIALLIVPWNAADAQNRRYGGTVTLADGTTGVHVNYIFFASDVPYVPWGWQDDDRVDYLRAYQSGTDGWIGVDVECGTRDYLIFRLQSVSTTVDTHGEVLPEPIVVPNECGSAYDFGTITLREPNVKGFVGSSEAYVYARPAGQTEFNYYSNGRVDANGNFSFYLSPGSYTLSIGGVTGETSPDIYDEHSITVADDGTADLGIWAQDPAGSDFGTPTKNELPGATLIRSIDHRVVSKDTIGLNAHWTLGSGGKYYDDYDMLLKESGVKWVREHFQSKLRIDQDNTWQKKYDGIINYYRNNNIHVVGLLAYGTDPANEKNQDLAAWSAYVKAIVERYGDYVKVWEIWNEPDQSKYLDPNTADAYIPILKTGYEAVKSVDPEAIVLGGSLSWPYASFVERLYRDAGNYFDDLAIHAYYCPQYFNDGRSHRQLTSMLNGVKQVIDRYRPGDRAWVTEIGCSSGTAGATITREMQRDYLREASAYLLSLGWIQNVFIYNFRDTATDNAYEDNFGLVTNDFQKKPLWYWYVSLTGGNAYAGMRTETRTRASFFAYADNLRHGFTVTGGNVRGGQAAEIITGTATGLGPHVRVFDGDGNVVSQFYAYDASLRNGVSVSACDVDADGYEEIITAQGRGGWPVVKIFDGYGNTIHSGFSVLDGKFTGGINLSCGDTNGDGVSEIVVAAARGGGPHVLVYDLNGQPLVNFMAYGQNFRGGINVTTIDMDGDGRDEIVTGPMYGAPHVQIFQVRPNELKRLSPGFYAFSSEYRGGLSVAGADTDGDGVKELLVGVGEDAQPLVKKYNIREQLEAQFFAYATNYLGGVQLAGGDTNGDGRDEVLVIPRGGGGPQVRVINVD